MLKILVASTVYHFEDQLEQICGVLRGFGYEVSSPTTPTICGSTRIPEADAICDLLKPFDQALMRRYEVSSRVNLVKNDDPECAYLWNSLTRSAFKLTRPARRESGAQTNPFNRAGFT